jgi:hypothetical protein
MNQPQHARWLTTVQDTDDSTRQTQKPGINTAVHDEGKVYQEAFFSLFHGGAVVAR